MKNTLIVFLSNLPSVACVIGAIILALHSIPGWGWFLFIAVLFYSSVSIKDN